MEQIDRMFGVAPLAVDDAFWCTIDAVLNDVRYSRGQDTMMKLDDCWLCGRSQEWGQAFTDEDERRALHTGHI